jgi:hypothetical protein
MGVNTVQIVSLLWHSAWSWRPRWSAPMRAVSSGWGVDGSRTKTGSRDHDTTTSHTAGLAEKRHPRSCLGGPVGDIEATRAMGQPVKRFPLILRAEPASSRLLVTGTDDEGAVFGGGTGYQAAQCEPVAPPVPEAASFRRTPTKDGVFPGLDEETSE